jgi:hypothetical protein
MTLTAVRHAVDLARERVLLPPWSGADKARGETLPETRHPCPLVVPIRAIFW